MQLTKCNEMDRLLEKMGNKIVKRLGNGPKWSNCVLGKECFAKHSTTYITNNFIKNKYAFIVIKCLA